MTVNLVYVMSRIYTEQHSKHEFINNIKNKINTKSELIFIKKYCKYESYLIFFPDVLSDIIMSYVNDIFVIEYNTNTFKGLVNVIINMKINYDYGMLDEDLHFYFYKNIITVNPLTRVAFKKWNSYMKYYYKCDEYLSCAQYDNIPYLTSYHRATKHMIVIVKKIIEIVNKLTKN